jgi:hypothetical protein
MLARRKVARGDELASLRKDNQRLREEVYRLKQTLRHLGAEREFLVSRVQTAQRSVQVLGLRKSQSLFTVQHRPP